MVRASIQQQAPSASERPRRTSHRRPPVPWAGGARDGGTRMTHGHTIAIGSEAPWAADGGGQERAPLPNLNLAQLSAPAGAVRTGRTDPLRPATSARSRASSRHPRRFVDASYVQPEAAASRRPGKSWSQSLLIRVRRYVDVAAYLTQCAAGLASLRADCTERQP